MPRIRIIRRIVINACLTVLNKLGCTIQLHNLPNFDLLRQSPAPKTAFQRASNALL